MWDTVEARGLLEHGSLLMWTGLLTLPFTVVEFSTAMDFFLGESICFFLFNDRSETNIGRSESTSTGLGDCKFVPGSFCFDVRGTEIGKSAPLCDVSDSFVGLVGNKPGRPMDGATSLKSACSETWNDDVVFSCCDPGLRLTAISRKSKVGLDAVKEVGDGGRLKSLDPRDRLLSSAIWQQFGA